MSGIDVGPLITALLPVLAVGGALVGIVIAAVRAKPGELMAENGKLRQEVRDVDTSLTALRDAFEAYKVEQRELVEQHDRARREDRRRIGVLVDGVNTMWNCLSVLTTMLHDAGQLIPEWPDSVRQTMQAARDAAQDGA